MIICGKKAPLHEKLDCTALPDSRANEPYGTRLPNCSQPFSVVSNELERPVPEKRKRGALLHHLLQSEVYKTKPRQLINAILILFAKRFAFRRLRFAIPLNPVRMQEIHCFPEQRVRSAVTDCCHFWSRSAMDGTMLSSSACQASVCTNKISQ